MSEESVVAILVRALRKRCRISRRTTLVRAVLVTVGVADVLVVAVATVALEK
jgi:hypothetical protein